MDIKKFSVPPFSAVITLGMNEGYTNKMITKETVIVCIQEYQDQRISESDIYLSVCISECEIVMSGQVEPHLKLHFINYPQFKLHESELIHEIENLAKYLMSELSQNRMVIEFDGETVMLERDSQIDPRIKQH